MEITVQLCSPFFSENLIDKKLEYDNSEILSGNSLT